MSSLKTLGVGFAVGFVLAGTIGTVGSASLWWNGRSAGEQHEAAMRGLQEQVDTLGDEIAALEDHGRVLRADAEVCDAERELSALNYGRANLHVETALGVLDEVQDLDVGSTRRVMEAVQLAPGDDPAAQARQLRELSLRLRAL